MKAYGITSGDAIKCGRVALLLASRGRRSTAGWVLSNCVVSGWSLVRESGGEIQSESRMRAIRTSGLMSGDGKRGDALRQHSRPSSTLPVEVLTWRGLSTYYVLFFLHLETGRVSLAGITRHPTETWMEQMARNAIDEDSGYLRQHRYLLHDRDTKFCVSFRNLLATGNVKCLALPPRSPNLNAFAERWVRSVKQECLSKLILFGEGSLRRALAEFLEHYHAERNHQGKGNVLLFPSTEPCQIALESVRRKQRLGGLLNHYCRAA
jgi:Integrase core domain